MRGGRRGFTLMELLTVIAIISLLVAILMPATLALRRRARETQAASERTALKAAILTYYSDTGLWPVDNQTQVTVLNSREIIPRLRPPNTPYGRIYWTGGDRIVDANNREYRVRINPGGRPPIGSADDFDGSYTVSFVRN